MSRVDGFGRIAVLMTAGLLVLLTTIMARIRHPWLEPSDPPARRDIPQAIARAIRDEAPA